MSAQTLITNLTHQLGQIGRGWSPGSIEIRDGLLNQLIADLKEYDAAELQTLRNEHLNQNGKMAAIAEKGTKFLETVAYLKTRATKREAEDHNFRARLYAVTSPIKDDLRRELRNGEIRHFLAAQTQPERDRHFLLASQEDRDEVLDAMLTGPLGPIVSDDMKSRALDARAQRLHGNDYLGFQQNTLLLDFVHMLQELIGRRLYGIGVDASRIKDVLGVTVTSTDEARRPSVTAEHYVGAK
jgi:hypothetical protein